MDTMDSRRPPAHPSRLRSASILSILSILSTLPAHAEVPPTLGTPFLEKSQLTPLRLPPKAKPRPKPAPMPLGTPFREIALLDPLLFSAPPPQPLHALLTLDFTDHYLTSNGLHVENQGLVAQPLLLLTYSPSSIPALTLTLGTWNSWHTHPSGHHPHHWSETDWLGGLTLTLARDWSLSAFYSRYESRTGSFARSSSLAFTLAHDSFLHPYITATRQTEGQQTYVFYQPLADESYSLQFGIAPSYTFQRWPIKVELPTYFTCVPDGFYQELRTETKTVATHYYGHTYHYRYSYPAAHRAPGGIGYLSSALRLSMPLAFIPERYGKWTAFTAAQYYHFINEGLLDGNQALGASTQRERALLQFHAGVSIYF